MPKDVLIILVLAGWLTNVSHSQDQGKGGCTTLMVHACIVAHSQMVHLKYFIFLKTIPPCLASSRAWRLSFGSEVCGLTGMAISLPSARVFIAPLVAPTAVANKSFFYSPILCLKSPSFKSWSSHMAIFAISIQNIIVS